MYRLFGLLIISLSLLTASIALQIAKTVEQELETSSIWLIITALILGIFLLIPKSKNEKKDEVYVSDEEIEAELLNNNYKNIK
ncbi:hypothetical protein V7161_24905 [Neobacillus drentensis]|uniref:hypothetical protein n=1 Tax=Neobacillus drentensis TaxID=220684 RepID=UPI00300274E6